MVVIHNLIKHDKYVEALCEHLDPHYDLLFKHVPIYSTKKRSKKQKLVGEIDVVAFKGDNYDIFEVKCSRRIVKAKKQLFKIKRALGSDKKLRNSFFFCGESGEMEKLLE